MSPCGSEPNAYEDDFGSALGAWCGTTLAHVRAAMSYMPHPSAGPGPDPDDRRFQDPVWRSHPYHRHLLQAYLTWSRLALAAAGTPYVPARRRRQAQLFTQLLTEALAPTNFLPSNPAALRLARDTRGRSLMRGAGNFLDDVLRRGGRPTKVPPDTYRLGENLAATPGRVVYRNELMEVLQYEPQTVEVRRVPLLLIPAWVNKFYIFDLAPGRSLVEWAVREGFTVFAISLRDPAPDQSRLGLEEYFLRAPLRALEIVGEITGERRAHLVGVCAGGMLAASAAAWFAAAEETGAASLTLLASALDYAPSESATTEPSTRNSTSTGDTAKTSEAELSLLTRLLSNRRGLVDGRKVSLLFDLLRAQDTIWQPLTSGWLLGERPRPFDIWAWSEDVIDVPRDLFGQTLRLARDNTLAGGRLRIGQRPIDLSTVAQDAFVVAGVRDHIISWETVYRSARLLGGDVSFHLVPSGHVGSIINPPRPGATYRTGRGALPTDPREWTARCSTERESWWVAWSRWLADRSGPRVPSRAPGSARHPAGAPAPGRYVRPR
ncbi:PHA/PHB synthase family protein [Streptomyces buecherae]|uniref:Alpha/beta fold hydrolase n=1 Tax=Streptomyces buecherae TaxID=2763006 RepID=A0A7H8NGB8_9ACTN|nr:alpha/beta fold hydrolase [Streptomyces buecherae]QKW53491.1 alpha/beta fold hydrolase [Streptomyces buecherae]